MQATTFHAARQLLVRGATCLSSRLCHNSHVVGLARGFCSSSTAGKATVEDPTVENEKRKKREALIQEMLGQKEEIMSAGVENPKQKSYSGMLVVCPTPIGNIRDVSLRVLEVLHDADIIACVDTRMAGKLFTLLREKRIKQEFEVYQGGNEETQEGVEDAKIFLDEEIG